MATDMRRDGNNGSFHELQLVASLKLSKIGNGHAQCLAFHELQLVASLKRFHRS